VADRRGAVGARRAGALLRPHRRPPGPHRGVARPGAGRRRQAHCVLHPARQRPPHPEDPRVGADRHQGVRERPARGLRRRRPRRHLATLDADVDRILAKRRFILARQAEAR
jgi:hypothetical protein